MNNKNTIIFLVYFIFEFCFGTQSFQVKVDSVTINVPAPSGFREISTLSPETWEWAEAWTPKDNRLLAVYVTENDVGKIIKGESAEFRRYMLLQINRGFERINVTKSSFLEFVKKIKQEQSTWMENYKDAADSFIEKSDKVSKDYDISINLKMGETVPLGVFIDNSNVIGFANITKYQGSIDNEKFDIVVVTGLNMIRVKNKLLYLYVYGKYESQNDIDWVHSISKNWVNNTVRANPLYYSNKSNHTITGLDWERVFGKVLVGAVIGGFLALVAGILKVISMFSTKKNDDT